MKTVSDTTNSKRLYVGNLNFITSWKGLKDHFSSCGTVAFAKVSESWYDTTYSGRPVRNGWGIVEYNSVAEAQAALDRMNHTTLDGREIYCREDRDDGKKKGKGKGRKGKGKGKKGRKGKGKG